MSYTLSKTINFGATHASLVTVGYTLYNLSGTVYANKVTSSTHEIPSGSGVYVSNVILPAGFIGSILWDTGDISPAYYSYDVIQGNSDIPNAPPLLLPPVVINVSAAYASGASMSPVQTSISSSGNVLPYPQPLTATYTDFDRGTTTISWSASSSSDVTEYQVKRDTLIIYTGAGTTAYDHPPAISGTIYSYTVITLDALGFRSVPSTASTITVS